MFETTWQAWKPTFVCLIFAAIIFLATVQKATVSEIGNIIMMAITAALFLMAIKFVPWKKK